MIKKYYSVVLILVSILAVSSIFLVEKTIKNNENKIKPEEKIEDKSSISEKVSSDTILVLKETININRGQCCEWILKNNIACGIYAKKGLFNKVFEKGTELKVEWATTKRVMLPCLTFSIEDQDTVICCKTSSGLEVYIVLVQGSDLSITGNRNKSYYAGSKIEPAAVSNLEEIFEIKVIE
jgi:hypothetical protein